MYLKKWLLKDNIDDIKTDIKISPIVDLVLKNRKLVNKNDIDNFLSGELIYEDPYILKDMDLAVCRIKKAIENDEKVIIYGDYDVDGITSTIVLFLYLLELGVNVKFYIPSRKNEGYGLNIEAIGKLNQENYQLMITVDNGITAIEEIEYANQLGLEVIVTDHHKPLERLPDAIAVINPHRLDCNSRFKDLAGVGVVFKLVSALNGDSKNILDKYGDIICLGTIADVMPIVDENREIVKYGLNKIRTNPNCGIQCLLDVIKMDKKDVKSSDISYKIVPRLNAASRMNEIEIALDLLLSSDYDEAIELAKRLDEKNSERKQIESIMLNEIEDIISLDSRLIGLPLIIIAKENWNSSIIGINASKLVDKYDKPCILISIDGELAQGSCRSIEGFPITDALICNKESLIKFGGHTQVAGFLMKTDKISEFIDNMQLYAKNIKDIPIKCYNVDAEVNHTLITVENIEGFKLLEPFGLGNENPILMIKNATIDKIYSISGGKYLKLMISFDDGLKLDVISFRITYNSFIYNKGDNVDILVSLDINNFRGVSTPSIIIQDIRLAGFKQEEYFNDRDFYIKIKNNSILHNNGAKLKSFVPTRDEVAIIYRYLKSIIDFKYGSINDLIEFIYIKLNYKFNFGKIGIILDILQELNIINFENGIKFLPTRKKMNIYESKSYKLVAK